MDSLSASVTRSQKGARKPSAGVPQAQSVTELMREEFGSRLAGRIGPFRALEEAVEAPADDDVGLQDDIEEHLL